MNDNELDSMTLEQKIFLWKSLPVQRIDSTDLFIGQLIAKIEELEAHK